MACVPCYLIHQAQLLTCIMGCVRAVSPAVSAMKSMCRTAAKFRSLSTEIPFLSLLPIFPLKCKSTTFCTAQKSEGKKFPTDCKQHKCSYVERPKPKRAFTCGDAATLSLSLHIFQQNVWCWLRGSNPDRNRAST